MENVGDSSNNWNKPTIGIIVGDFKYILHPLLGSCLCDLENVKYIQINYDLRETFEQIYIVARLLQNS